MGGSEARTLAVLAARRPPAAAAVSRNTPSRFADTSFFRKPRVTMALRQHVVIASVVLLVVLLQEGLALTCYQCNSHNDTRCSMKEVPKDLAQPCPEPKGEKPFILCRKIKQIIDFEVNGLPPDNRVIRSCGWDDSNYKNRCYHRSGFGGRQEVCACEGDNCNAAASIAGPVALLAAAVIAAGARMAL